MRLHPLFAVFALAATGALAQQPPMQPGYEVTGITPRLKLDHYDPERLRQFATDKARAGETTTAWILLERAALLAPHDARVVQALAAVRAQRKGEPAPPEEVPAPPGKPAPAVGIAPEPPSLWPPAK